MTLEQHELLAEFLPEEINNYDLFIARVRKDKKDLKRIVHLDRINCGCCNNGVPIDVHNGSNLCIIHKILYQKKGDI